MSGEHEADFAGRLRRELEALYGDRLDRLVLFGSRARGDDHADSDWDVAVVLHGPANLSEEQDRLSDLRYELLMETGAFVEMFALTEHDLRKPTLFNAAVRQDGIPL